MDTDPISPVTATATAENAAFVYHEWDRRTRAHDIEGLLELYLPDAILETPLIPRILDQQSGVLTGHDQIRPFFQRGTDNRPNELVRWYRTGRYLFDGQTLSWEYPRQTPTRAIKSTSSKSWTSKAARSLTTASTGAGTEPRSYCLQPHDAWKSPSKT